MEAEESVSVWMEQLKAGDAAAAQLLWDRYFVQLVGVARKRMYGAARALADEEDVALSAFKSFFLAAEKGRFPKLDDRDDLWKVLVVIAERKALNLMRDQRRLKRGGSAAAIGGQADGSDLVANVPGREPTPFFAALMVEECNRLLATLDNETLRQLALDKMEGYSNEEIAKRRSLALRTVERKLGLIRRLWEEADGS